MSAPGGLMLLSVSSGLVAQPELVAPREVGVVLEATLELRDAGRPGPEGMGDDREADAGTVARNSERGAIGYLGWVGEQLVDLAGHVPLEAADDLAIRLACGRAPSFVVLGSL